MSYKKASTAQKTAADVLQRQVEQDEFAEFEVDGELDATAAVCQCTLAGLMLALSADWEDPVQKVGDAGLWEHGWDDAAMNDDFARRLAQARMSC